MFALSVCGLPCGSAGKEFACNEGDLGLVPGLGRSPGEGKDSPFQYSGLENSMDCIAHGVAKSRPRLSDFHFHFPTVYHRELNSISCDNHNEKEYEKEYESFAVQQK